GKGGRPAAASAAAIAGRNYGADSEREEHQQICGSRRRAPADESPFERSFSDCRQHLSPD
ncbi:MAG: hypothetical protein ACR2LS_04690, partial [Thermomicrobiales bacterium]